MILWAVAAVVVLAVGVAPGLYVASRGSSVHRLIGVQLAAASSVIVLVCLCVLARQSSYLIVPLVLAILSSTGTLVYTRLLRPHIDDVGGSDG